MNVLFKKKLLVLGLLGWIESVNAQEDHLNTLIKKVAVSPASDRHFNNIENQMLGRASWKIKCEYRKYDEVKACVMRKGPLSVARINHDYVVNVGEHHAPNSYGKIRIDQHSNQQQLGGFFRNGQSMITQFKTGHFAYTQYQNNEHRIVEHQLSLLGFTYAFNDMQEQFNRISSKTY